MIFINFVCTAKKKAIMHYYTILVSLVSNFRFDNLFDQKKTTTIYKNQRGEDIYILDSKEFALL